MPPLSANAFWWRYARAPLFAFAVLAILFPLTSLDTTLASALFYDGTRWIGADSWWTNQFLHEGGRWAMRLVAAAALVVAVVGRILPRYGQLQRPATYVALAMILSTGIVGLIKSESNIDCPSDLAGFGGDRPHVGVFADRPDYLPHAACFPAAHSSSGYSLFAFYFLWLERKRRLSRAGLALALGVGLVFGIAQQSRGAHFVSHDVWSAFLVWMICLTLYVYGFKRRLFGMVEIESIPMDAQPAPT
jgi:membrane-associated PAP2 superfamily phosphatase